MEGPIAWVDGQYLGGAPGWEPEVRWTPWIQGRADKNVWSKTAGLGRDHFEGSGQSLPRTHFLCQVTQLSLLRWQEALQTVCFLALCRWQGRFIRPGEEQWPACYLFMISNSRVRTWYRGGGANRGADTTLTPSTFTWPDCVSATCPPICHNVRSCWGPETHRGCSTCRPIYLCRLQCWCVWHFYLLSCKGGSPLFKAKGRKVRHGTGPGQK